MPTPPRSPRADGTPGDPALAAALRLLTSRGRSRRELTEKLARKGYDAAQIAQTLERVTQLGYLDEQTLALARATSLLRDQRQAPSAVRERLRRQGFSEPDLEKALGTAVSELGYDPQAAARSLLNKRGLGGPLASRDRARAARLLQARGFEEALIEALLPESSTLDSSEP